MVAIIKKDEDVIREITEYQGNYLPLDKDRLVLFAVNFLESKKIEATFDKIVATSFRLFPKKFSLIGFPEYPDGKTIYYCVYNHCTLTKKWLSGNVQSAFTVTTRGKYYFDETLKIMDGRMELTRIQQVSPRRKEITFMTSLKKTNAFKKYVKGEKELVNKSEILEALRIPTGSEGVIQVHLAKYLEYASRVNDLSTLEFLDFAKTKLKE